jgi:hypothetical protein
VAHVQRAGRIGRDELDQHLLAGGGLLAEGGAGGIQHLAHDLLLGGRLQADVEKAGAGDLDGFDPLAESGGGEQRGAQLFGQFAGLAAERFGELHGGRAGEIAMGSHLGRLERGFGASAGREGFERVRERREQLLFDQ